MFRRITTVLAALFAAGTLALGAGAAANASTHPNTESAGTVDTTNNGVAGYYSDATDTNYTFLGFTATPGLAAENMVLGMDGIGGQLCNASNGRVAGVGLERSSQGGYEVVYGNGWLHGDPGAQVGNGTVTGNRPDANPCFGGILPAANLHVLSLSTPILQGDSVQFSLTVYTVKINDRVRYRIAVHARDTYTGDTANAVMAIGTGNPWFDQSGVGSQRSLAGLTSPASTDTADTLAVFSHIDNAQRFDGKWSDFGCSDVTTEVNSAANSNNDNGLDANAFAQIDPVNSLGGGCGYAPTSAAFTLFEGKPIS